tara:strand:- start:5010 stop:5591 length:582 start_codon:yes stop_codon:yes gene_type:complete
MKKYLISILLIMLVYNCAGNSGPDLSPGANRKVLKSAPDWFLNTPSTKGYKYHAATATSQDLQAAISKAELDAANALSGQMESEMNAVIRRAQEETGLNFDSEIIDKFSKTQEQIISNSLRDYSISKKEIQEERSDKGNIYRAYILIEWDEGAAQNRLLKKMKEDEQIYTLMRSTELFDEMEKRVEEYRNRIK